MYQNVTKSNICKEFEEAGDMVPVNVELVNHLWLPNIFIYNLKTFKVPNIFYLQSKDFQGGISSNHIFIVMGHIPFPF